MREHPTVREVRQALQAKAEKHRRRLADLHQQLRDEGKDAIDPGHSAGANDIKFNITGDRGMINLDLSNSQLIERFTEQKNDRPDVLVQHFIHGKARGFAFESIRHFIDHLVSGEEFLVSLEDAANTSLVILAIMESAKTGVPVKVRSLA